jgi:hypothetical protein
MTFYYVRLVSGAATSSPLFTKAVTFAGHIPSEGDRLVLRNGKAPEAIQVSAAVVDVTWRADFTALEVTVEPETDEWDIQRVVNDGSWTTGRASKPKPTGNPLIDDDDE